MIGFKRKNHSVEIGYTIEWWTTVRLRSAVQRYSRFYISASAMFGSFEILSSSQTLATIYSVVRLPYQLLLLLLRKTLTDKSDTEIMIFYRWWTPSGTIDRCFRETGSLREHNYYIRCFIRVLIKLAHIVLFQFRINLKNSSDYNICKPCMNSTALSTLHRVNFHLNAERTSSVWSQTSQWHASKNPSTNGRHPSLPNAPTAERRHASATPSTDVHLSMLNPITISLKIRSYAINRVSFSSFSPMPQQGPEAVWNVQ